MTKSWVALVWALVGCGGMMPGPGPDSGSPPVDGAAAQCSPCVRGFALDPATVASGACVCAPSGRWVITVTSGTVPARNEMNATWDALGGLPDPKVCLTLGGSRRCTPMVADTMTPSWNFAFPATAATELRSGVMVEYLDEDISSDDPICAGRIVFGPEDFQAGARTVSCMGSTAAFNTRLAPE